MDEGRRVDIVMEYVPGEELSEWARHHNPNALESVEVLLELTRGDTRMGCGCWWTSAWPPMRAPGG